MNKIYRNIGCALLVAAFAVYASALAAEKIKEPTPGMESGLSHELTQATLHASYAATGTSLEDIHDHLSHVVNCLVGPEGAAFDADALNPCRGMGKGAIPDATDPALKANLEKVLEHILAALRTNDFILAKDAARIALWTLMTST